MFDIQPLLHAPGHHTLMSRLRFMGALRLMDCSLALILHSSFRRLWLQAKLERIGLSQRHLARNLCKPTWTYIHTQMHTLIWKPSFQTCTQIKKVTVTLTLSLNTHYVTRYTCETIQWGPYSYQPHTHNSFLRIRDTHIHIHNYSHPYPHSLLLAWSLFPFMDASYSQKRALEVEKACMCEVEMQWFHYETYFCVFCLGVFCKNM